MSSDDVVVHVEGVGKEYKLGMLEPYKALRDVLTNAGAAPFRAATRLARRGSSRDVAPPRRPRLWALRDVSFDVVRGEVLGLIGANGAGKSTMLKLLARITAPTEGLVTLRGRVGSLLEVGTGFHPELTGRENVYLNGVDPRDAADRDQRRFDEIVEFAGVAKFLDTPVKRYSSGMQVRLAFAVAAHLQPEILLIDEVLAVGDAEFQKKCLGKMEDVTKEGRTVVFVSHNMAAVRSLCPRALVLDHGQLVFGGPTEDAVQHYLGQSTTAEAWVEGDRLQGFRTVEKIYGSDPVLSCHALGIVDEAGVPRGSFRSDEDISVVVDYECLEPVGGVTVIVDLIDRTGLKVLRSESIDDPETTQSLERGRYRSTCVLPAGLFGDAHLRVAVRVSVPLRHTIGYGDVLELDVAFQGLNGNPSSDATLRPMLAWRTEATGTAYATR